MSQGVGWCWDYLRNGGRGRQLVILQRLLEDVWELILITQQSLSCQAFYQLTYVAAEGYTVHTIENIPAHDICSTCTAHLRHTTGAGVHPRVQQPHGVVE